MKLGVLKDMSAAQLLSVQLDTRPVEECDFGAQTVAVLKKLEGRQESSAGVTA